MNKLFLLFILFFYLVVNSLQAKSSLQKIASFGTNPGKLNAYLFSDIIKDSIRKPLVIALHGCTQNANSFNQQSGWSNLATKNNFYILYPEQRAFNNPNNCFNWFQLNDITGNKGEVFSIYEMIVYVCQNYPIDLNNIFITGLSAGAVMSVAVAINYPHLFKSVAVFGGGAYYGESIGIVEVTKLLKKAPVLKAEDWIKKLPNGVKKDSVAYPQLIVVHGTKDDVVNYSHAQSLIAQWCAIHEIDTIPNIKEPDFLQNPKIVRYLYQNNKIMHYAILGLGHALPIDPGKNIGQGGQAGIFAKDCNFYSIYQIASDFGLIHF